MLLPAEQRRIRPRCNAWINGALMQHRYRRPLRIKTRHDLFHGKILRVGIGFVGERRRKNRNHSGYKMVARKLGSHWRSLVCWFFPF